MKYIVYWVITIIVPTSCPYSDPFGRQSNISCAVWHTKEERVYKERVFTNRSDARKFYNMAIIEPDIDSVGIDSFYVPRLTTTLAQ